MSTTQLALWGPYPDVGEAELLRRVEHTVTSRGYAVTQLDVSEGVLEVRANADHSCPNPPTFLFRCYRGGWVELQVRSCEARRLEDGRYSLPSNLHQEYVGLADGLLVAPARTSPAPVPSSYEAAASAQEGSGWPVAPSVTAETYVLEPVASTQPDEGIVLGGLGLFIGAYVTGLMFPGGAGLLSDQQGYAALALIPLGQWAVGFAEWQAWPAFVVGGFFGLVQLLALVTMAAGRAHHRPALRSGHIEAGTLSLTPGGLEIAF